jgi:hypothetical protein
VGHDRHVRISDLFVHSIVHRNVITEKGGLDGGLLFPPSTSLRLYLVLLELSKNDIRFGLKNVNYTSKIRKNDMSFTFEAAKRKILGIRKNIL